MTIPPVRDATIRYLVLTLVGALLLSLLPDGVFGTAPLWRFLDGAGPTLANLVGIVVVTAAWIYFTLVVIILRGRPGFCRAGCLAVDVLAFAVFLLTALAGATELAVGLLALPAAASLALSYIMERQASANVRRGSELAPGLS